MAAKPDIIMDKAHQPTREELAEYVGAALFAQFLRAVEDAFSPIFKLEYSGDVWAPGWNIKLRKAGRALCAVYPRKGYFTVLVVVGPREKPDVEALLPCLSPELCDIYRETREGNGQRWLMVDLRGDGALYRDVLELIRIRRAHAYRKK